MSRVAVMRKPHISNVNHTVTRSNLVLRSFRNIVHSNCQLSLTIMPIRIYKVNHLCDPFIPFLLGFSVLSGPNNQCYGNLFNLYSEEILARALHGAEECIKVNGNVIKNILYTDDTVLIAGSKQDFQILLNKAVRVGELHDLKIRKEITSNGDIKKVLVET